MTATGTIELVSAGRGGTRRCVFVCTICGGPVPVHCCIGAWFGIGRCVGGAVGALVIGG